MQPDALTAAHGWLEQERRKWEVSLDQLDAFIATLAEPAVRAMAYDDSVPGTGYGGGCTC
jgi:hypothetical protein